MPNTVAHNEGNLHCDSWTCTEHACRSAIHDRATSLGHALTTSLATSLVDREHVRVGVKPQRITNEDVLQNVRKYAFGASAQLDEAALHAFLKGIQNGIDHLLASNPTS